MSVYVDALQPRPSSPRWKHGDSCHLTADTLDELHTFARRIGLRRGWFQNAMLPHYDLTARRRLAALAAGAIPIDRNEVARRIRQAREVSRG